MSTLVPTVTPGSLASLAIEEAPVASPFWKIAILVALNFLSVPLAIPIFYYTGNSIRYWGPWLWFSIIGIYHGQLFLLAYWMTFGGTPKNGRRTLMAIFACCGAVAFALMNAHSAFLYYNRGVGPRLQDLDPILTAVIVVWSLHLVLLLPKFLFQIVITFSELRSSTPRPTQDTLPHHVGHWLWMSALPLVLFFALEAIDREFFKRMVGHVAITTIFSLLALAPASLLLVRESNFLWNLLGSAGWASLVLLTFLLIPPRWFPEDTVTSHAAACSVVLLNLLVLRSLGLRWLPNEAAPLEKSPLQP